MIISPRRHFIFVHIPKTGGTALSLALESRAMADDILIGDTPKAKRRKRRLHAAKTAGRLWKHATLADIAGLLPAGEIRACRVFTIVRNPWDRLVSYYHWLRVQTFDHAAVSVAKAHDFSGFLNHPHTQKSLRAETFGGYVAGAEGHTHQPVFLRHEQLEEDLGALWQHLGFNLSPLPRANESDRQPDYRPYYTPADAALVATLCATDIARFSYRFDP